MQFSNILHQRIKKRQDSRVIREDVIDDPDAERRLSREKNTIESNIIDQLTH